MACCPNCQSRFFKTLGIKVDSQPGHSPALLVKRRCKRCKHKNIFRKDAITGRVTLATWDLWHHLPAVNTKDTVFRLHVSQYTRRISRSSNTRLERFYNDDASH